MIEITYTQAYTEVLEVLKHLPQNQYDKIPKDKIEFYKNNCDTLYNFKLEKDLKNVSTKANAIIISIYKDYFTTQKQKETLKNVLEDNTKKVEEIKRKKYNPDNLFKNNTIQKEEVVEEQENENIQMVENKEENIFQKMLNKLKSIVSKIKKN